MRRHARHAGWWALYYDNSMGVRGRRRATWDAAEGPASIARAACTDVTVALAEQATATCVPIRLGRHPIHGRRLDSADCGPGRMSSTATAFEPPEARWDDLQAAIHTVRATLPPGLVTVRWPDASLEQAVAALDRDGAFVLENAASAEACDAVREQMRPYVEASTETADGSNTRRPGAVIGRSRASWALATHPFLRQVCEGVLGRQVLTRSSDEVAAELFADRGFKQHPYYLDISMLIAVGPGGLAQGLHLDAGKHIMDFRPFGIETTISTMWALSDFSADGGATSVCLGSRHWGRWRRPSRDEAVPATMSKGSCLVFSGNTWHGSGENASPNIRWGLNIDYSVAVSVHAYFCLRFWICEYDPSATRWLLLVI
jgi:ectoine hydroxylase-related dioxygenase (phytanoyl-CoA dioxygenase family)